MKKLVLAIVSVMCLVGCTSTTQVNKTVNHMTVGEFVELDKSDEIVIKEDMTVVFSGDYYNMPNDLKSGVIKEISVTDDTENSITLFVKY